MESTPAHRELFLPTPTKDAPSLSPFLWNSPKTCWIEIHRSLAGRVRYAIGSESEADLDSLTAYLENSRPRIAFGPPIGCPVAELVHRGRFAQAQPRQKHHHLPLRIPTATDPAGFLVRTLASPVFEGHDVILQLLFRRTWFWESSFYTTRYEVFAQRQNRTLRAEMDARRAEPAYHVELRAHVGGPRPEEAVTALGSWLEQWTTFGGNPWRSWAEVSEKIEQPFHAAFAAHDITRFANGKGRRDVSGAELANLLSIPWASHHPECSYAGPPAGHPKAELVIADRDTSPRLVVGASGTQRVALPANWNHLALIGRTQSGKSTLALNLVLQVLSKNPDATVVVIEPTGSLVDGIVSRLPREVAEDTIEIVPAHATFADGDTTMASVPIGLLLPPAQDAPGTRLPDTWSEALAGDLLAAIRNAWGEESIGGRAELVLRALVQGLALTPGSNLVDAYHILSSKPALQRFVKSAPPGPLRSFLEHHLPRLDYAFTMSSLDKVGKIATNPLLRVALCQRVHSVSFDRLLDHRLLLLNLSKAAVGSDGANFLGAIYLTQLWASLQRSGSPDRPVYLVLDEVHNYAIPALADMLSEGAKFGLHVVVTTQYLYRVPPRVRAALMGNVDAWLLFSLGVEDMDDAWKIANGAAHGWVPQDLVEGLRPHEVAMSVRGDLLRVATLPAPSASPSASELRVVVTRSSRRYAQPEDSEASPWLVGQDDLETVLGAIGGGPKTARELAGRTGLTLPQVEGAITRLEGAGDADWNHDHRAVKVTPRGATHLVALRARRNEGEEHVETMTDLAMFLDGRGISLRIMEQMGGLLLPDGQFQWRGVDYNVEVECSTVAKAGSQVVRNVKKGLAAHARVLIVLPDRSSLPRVLTLLEEAVPRFTMWKDPVGVVWREPTGAFRPYRGSGGEVWGFLDENGPWDEEDWEEDEPDAPYEEPVTDPLMEGLRSAIFDLRTAGRASATAHELLGALSPSERDGYSEERVGRALSALGVRARRVKADGTRYRVYDLTGHGGSAEISDMGPVRDRRGGTRNMAPGEQLVVRAADPPSEDSLPDQRDPAGPED